MIVKHAHWRGMRLRVEGRGCSENRRAKKREYAGGVSLHGCLRRSAWPGRVELALDIVGGNDTIHFRPASIQQGVKSCPGYEALDMQPLLFVRTPRGSPPRRMPIARRAASSRAPRGVPTA